MVSVLNRYTEGSIPSMEKIIWVFTLPLQGNGKPSSGILPSTNFLTSQSDSAFNVGPLYRTHAHTHHRYVYAERYRLNFPIIAL